MKKWFREDTLDSVLCLMFAIAKETDTRRQALMFVVASQVVREVASVDPRCTHHLVTLIKPFIDPLPLWRQRMMAASALARRTRMPGVSVLQASALNYALEPGSVGFALLHPPYLGMIHYHLIHRLATDILEIIQVVAAPGALMPYRFDYEWLRSQDASTDDLDAYRSFVANLSMAIEPSLARDGRCAVIIGDQRHRGHIRHPSTLFVDEFEKRGLLLEESFIWVLQNNGGMHVLRRGHFIDHNYIMVFHKPLTALA